MQVPLAHSAERPPEVPEWLNHGMQSASPMTQPSSIPSNPIPRPATTTVQAPSMPSKEDQSELLLPTSGLPPVPHHLVQAISANSFIELGELLPKALCEAHFERVQDSHEETKGRKPPGLTHCWTGWWPSPPTWQWQCTASTAGLRAGGICLNYCQSCST